MAVERATVSRRIEASPQAIFTVITDPAMHVEIDGSGMLVAAPDARPLHAAGDTFDMHMDREALGDIPLGKYTVRNTVTRIVPGRTLEWNIGGVGQPAFGHVYGYELRAVPPDATEVTLYVDWSGVPDERIRLRFPIVPLAALEKSLENLERIVASQGPGHVGTVR